MASIAAFYLLGGALYTRRAGLFAALLFAVSSFQIQFAQTARMYSMLVFFAALSTFFLVRLVDDHSFENRLWYGAMTSGMLLTHVYGSFVLFGQLLFLVSWLAKDWDFMQLKKWAATQSLAVGLFVPWFAFVAAPSYVLDEGSEISWLTEPGIENLRSAVFAFAGIPMNYPRYAAYGPILKIGVVLAVIMFLCVFWRIYVENTSDRTIKGANLAVALLVGLLVVPFVVSHMVVPLFGVRYTIFAFVPIAVLVGKSLDDIDYRPGRLIACHTPRGACRATARAPDSPPPPGPRRRNRGSPCRPTAPE
jgi:uncharacterized membrane protein